MVYSSTVNTTREVLNYIGQYQGHLDTIQETEKISPDQNKVCPRINGPPLGFFRTTLGVFGRWGWFWVF